MTDLAKLLAHDFDEDVKRYREHPENYAIDLLARRVESRIDGAALEALDLAALRQYGLHETRVPIKLALMRLHEAVAALGEAYREEDAAGPGGAVG